MMKRSKYVAKKPVAETISIKEIAELGNEILDPELRCLYYLLYLSGARISEALKMRVKDIQFKIDKLGQRMAIFSIITAKHRQHPVREIPVIIKEYEKSMMDFIEEYISDKLMDEFIFRTNQVNARKRMTRVLSTYVRARKQGEIIESYEKKINPHYLRHCRLTHLRRDYGFDAVDLMQYAGWSSVQPAETYLHLGYKDLAKKMVSE